MRLISPQRINIPFAATFPITYNVKDQNGVELPRVFLSLMLPNNTDDKPSISFKVGDIRPSEKQLADYFGMENLIKTSVTNAELINTNMRNYVLQHLCRDKEERQQIYKLDFMTLKDYFLKFVKKDVELKNIPLINTPEKFKNFRVDFDSYISDRNIYTHGQLKFIWASQQFVIQYVSKPEMQPAYVMINVEVLISNNNFYKTLNQFLSDFLSMLSKRRKNNI